MNKYKYKTKDYFNKETKWSKVVNTKDDYQSIKNNLYDIFKKDDRYSLLIIEFNGEVKFISVDN
jgi:hypothetical protein